MTVQPLPPSAESTPGWKWSPGPLLMAVACISWLIVMWPLFLAGPLTLDEHGSYWILDSDLPGTALERSLNYAAIPPLSGWVQQACVSLLGKSEFSFRLSSALGLLGAAFAVYACGKMLRDATVGGLAALLLVWHPEAMDETRIARCYGLALLMSALVLLATVWWQRRPESARRALVWALAGAGLAWTHYTAVLMVAATGLFIAGCCLTGTARFRDAFVALLCAPLMLGLLCWPLLAPVARLSEWGPYLNYMPPSQALGALVGPIWWAGLPAGWLLSRLIPARSSVKHSVGTATLVLLVLGSLVPILIMAGMAMQEAGGMSSLANPRYRVAYAPACTLLIALLLTAQRTWRAALPAAVLALVVSWGLAERHPWQLGRLGQPADADWRGLNRHLAENASLGEPLLVQSGLTEGFLVPAYATDPLFMEYVACRVSRFYVEAPHPRIALPFLYDPQTGIEGYYRSLLSDWGREGSSFWVAAATDTDLNQNSLDGIRAIAAQSGFVEVESQVWPAATLIRYARPTEPRE